MVKLIKNDKKLNYHGNRKQYVYKKEGKGLNFVYREYNSDKNIIYIKNDNMRYETIKRYFKEISDKFEKIQLDEKRLSGMPVVKDTRIPISLVLACLKDEMTIQDICDEYRLAYNDVEEAVEYAIEILDIPYQGEE